MRAGLTRWGASEPDWVAAEEKKGEREKKMPPPPNPHFPIPVLLCVIRGGGGFSTFPLLLDCKGKQKQCMKLRAKKEYFFASVLSKKKIRKEKDPSFSANFCLSYFVIVFLSRCFAFPSHFHYEAAKPVELNFLATTSTTGEGKKGGE